MKSDVVSCVVIVAAITAFVVGFIVWKKAAPKSRRPEQIIFLSVSALGAVSFVWFAINAYLVWRDTGINTMRGDYLRFAQVAGLTVLFGVAFWASRAKEKEERSASLVSDDEEKKA
ncbi:MAG TPA: hypothetical protein VHC20_05295 [Candidatus Paceibacterota bacterium]|nr:hypothetical protein [Candidatus Paceibacterota bacterium]HVX91009.1 hypothetical protein [Candidatus Paceibacterota bacterium]